MDDELDDLFRERRRLMALAYRMTGTLADAEDVVQETYVRWYRLEEPERAAIENPAGWLTRVASRVALDLLASARNRRERYVGPWLPEPVPADFFGGTAVNHRALHVSGAADATDPANRVTLDDAVSTALLLVLESMTPAERVAFVLHDVFAVPFDEIAEIVGRSPVAVRQLASTGRRHVRDGRTTAVPRDEHDRTVRAFLAATRSGDLLGLARVLAPDVELRSDGGGLVSAARRPVAGQDRVARYLLGVGSKQPDLAIEEQQLGGGLGLVLRSAGAVTGVMSFYVENGLVTDVWIMLNPTKLAGWLPAAERAREDEPE